MVSLNEKITKKLMVYLNLKWTHAKTDGIVKQQSFYYFSWHRPNLLFCVEYEKYISETKRKGFVTNLAQD